jgi:hypothetical protein
MKSPVAWERPWGPIARWLLLLACLARAGGLAHGAAEAILGYTESLSAYVGTTVGWTFQTTNVLTVTELGCFKKVFDDNPAAATIQVGLWDHTGVLLASNSITPSSRLSNQTRYESVAPVPLPSGQVYYLGAYDPSGAMGLDVGGTAADGVVVTAKEVQLRGAAASDAGFGFPAEIPGTGGSIYAGPNFAFLSQPALVIELWAGGQVRLSWFTAYSGYTLQSKTGLFGAWGSAGLTVSTVGNRYVAFDTIGGGPKYYRLIK